MVEEVGEDDEELRKIESPSRAKYKGFVEN